MDAKKRRVKDAWLQKRGLSTANTVTKIDSETASKTERKASKMREKTKTGEDDESKRYMWVVKDN